MPFKDKRFTLDDTKTIQDWKKHFREIAKQSLINLAIAKFEEAGLIVEQNVLEDDHRIIYVSKVPVFLAFDDSERVIICTEKYWLEKLKMPEVYQKMLMKRTNWKEQYSVIEDCANEILDFLDSHPTYGNQKLEKPSEYGMFEHIKTFENFNDDVDWKKSDKLSDANRKTGIFEDEKEQEDVELYNGILVDYAHETATVQGDGEVKLGVLYDDNHYPMDDTITIQIEPNASGWAAINVADLVKLIKVAQTRLDNFPTII